MAWGDKQTGLGVGKKVVTTPKEIVIKQDARQIGKQKVEETANKEFKQEYQADVKEDLSWLDKNAENILIFGPPKHGKTYAYMSYVEHTLKNKGHVYILSTDGGVSRTLKRYFSDAGVKNYKKLLEGNITYQHIYSVDEARNFWLDIRERVQEKDLLIIDLISIFWEWLQADFVEHISKGNLTEYIMGAMADKKKFGLFEGSKWNYIKAAHRFMDDIVNRRKCNIIAVATEKETEGEKAIGGSKAEGKLKKIYLTEMSVRAGGQKELPYLFDTMIRIACIGDKKYAMLMVGDRGHSPDGKVIVYGTNLRETINEWRKDN